MNSLTSKEQFHRAVWRWHFFAGAFVLPMVLLLSLTGALMLISKPIETQLLQSRYTVTPAADRLQVSQLLQTVEQAYPNGKVNLYFPPTVPEQAARFSVLLTSSHGHSEHAFSAPSEMVWINPYSGNIIGRTNPEQSWYLFFKKIHGTLLLGDVGDALIEIMAGLAILMIGTGLYLAWPKQGMLVAVRSLRIAQARGPRFWHQTLGWAVAVPLIFFLLSGLAWTNVWGGKLVQPWSSLPSTSYRADSPAPQHDSMNHEGVHAVPWAVEQTPMPVAQKAQDAEVTNLDHVLERARGLGFDHFRIHLPMEDQGVWTISATTIAGDIQSPGNERIVHLNQSDGQLLADIRFSDYSLMGKAMAAFIPFHQGDLGWFNWLFNLILLGCVVLLLIMGLLLWWRRTNTLSSRLMPPPASMQTRISVTVLLILFCLVFPMSVGALLLAWLISAIWHRFNWA